jgi:hypothetical protein
MNHKLLIMGMIVVLLLLVSALIIFFIQNNTSHTFNSPSAMNPLKNIPSSTVTMSVWSDIENGVNFSLPSNFNISKTTDASSVASFVITQRESRDSISFKIQEPVNAYSLKEWLPTYKEATNASSVTGITVGGEKASQYVYKNPYKTATAMFHLGVLYYFELLGDESENTQTYNTILSTFQFAPEPTSQDGGNTGYGGDGGNVIDEGEEVVE